MLAKRIPFLIRLAIQSRPILTNWLSLLLGTIREFRGRSIPEAPLLKFRSGLEIGMVPGGYGGFYLIFPEIFVDNCYEPTPDFAIRAGWRVLDIGANMGFFSCKAGMAAKDVHLVAVEPVQGYYRKLKENLVRNRIGRGIALHAAAVGTPTKSISITSWFTSSGEQKVLMSAPPEGARILTEEVPAMTLAEIMAAGKMDRCDLMKMDIEGAEFAIFAESPPEIWARIDRIVMETHEEEGKRSQGELVDTLKKQGFTVTTQPMFLYALRTTLLS